MQVFDHMWLKAGVAKQMRFFATGMSAYDGLPTPRNQRLLNDLTGIHLPTGTRLIFSRDEGMHSCGWWKNPDYERCYHLSLSFVDVRSGEDAPKDIRLTDEWLEVFYGDDRRYVWAEPPYSPDGKRCDTWHYRVFCNPMWVPILPRGEVYSKDNTPAGWMSYSELKNAHHRALAQLTPQAGEQ